MKKMISFKKNLKISIILLTILLTSLYTNTSMDENQLFSNSDNDTNADNINDDIELKEDPEVNFIGQDDWWNQSFAYRRVINITNPYDVKLEHYGVNVTFNYESTKMNSSLKDIRIVKNNQLIKYYVKNDYPSSGQGTVWFEADVEAKSTSTDYYMYYGNKTVDYAQSYYMDKEVETFGWIKNGNFELDIKPGSREFSYHGWNWSTDTPTVVPLCANSNDWDDELTQHNITTININQSRVYEGKYSYKWGWYGNFINHTSFYNYSSRLWTWINREPDYRGTLYSNRFVVPKVTAQGTEEAKIYIHLYRNIRTSHFESNEGYFLKICPGNSYGSLPNNHGILNWIEVYGYGSNDISYEKYVPTNIYRIRSYNKLRNNLNISAPYVNTRYNLQVDSPGMDVNQDGKLTGVIYIDVTAYQGQEIFLETGMVGSSDGEIGDAAFGQIDDIRFNYTLQAKLNDEQNQFAKLTVITKDVNGNIVPHAEVTLLNGTDKKFSLNTSIDGQLTFSPLTYGEYNITVNYTTRFGYEIVVLNKTKVYYDSINPITILILHLWKIEFSVKDWNSVPLNYGFVNVTETQGSKVLDTLELDSNGNATFYWKNETTYYYEVYYDNIDYINRYTLLNTSTSTSKLNLIKTNMSKLEIKIIDNMPSHNPVPGVLVKVINGTTGQSIVNLTTDSDGYVHGQINSGLEFWYIHGYYNFSLQYGLNPNFAFNVSISDQWIYGKANDHYNYSLNKASSLEFTLFLNALDYLTEFRDQKGDSQVVIWGEFLSFQLNFTHSSDGGITWTAIDDPLYVKYEILEFGKTEIIKSGDMDSYGNGIFNITFNSSKIIGGKGYILTVYGKKLGYTEPDPADFAFTINAFPTDFRVHDYSNNHELIPSEQLSQYFGEIINVSISYFKLGDQSARLHGAKLSYDWDYGSGSNIGEDSVYPGYYTFLLDTSVASDIGVKKIEITIVLQNYSTIIDSINLLILERKTTINGAEEICLMSASIYIGAVYNFTFEYNDTTLGINTRLNGLSEASYILLTNPGLEIPLIERPDIIYVLDYNTSKLSVGTYRFVVTMKKLNYEGVIAIVDLIIIYRYFDTDFDATNLDDDIITIVKGKKISFEITLTDPTQRDIPLTGATVILEINGDEYEFDEVEPGIYELEFDTDDFDAFFTSQTETGTIKISKADYISDEIDITIVVEMEEIMPGIPAFYFILGVAIICAITGSLITYRYIQVARIPKFVKKVKKIKKAIKSGDKISESLLYPTKESFVVKKLEDKFKILGISYKKLMKISDEKEILESKKSIKSSRGEL